jgi:basic membrane protein A
MSAKKLWSMLTVLMVVSMIIAACAPAATPAPTQPAAPAATSAPAQPAAPTATTAPAAPAALTIPDIVAGKFNVAVVLVGFHADGGWSQAHVEGAQWMAQQDPSIAIAYLDTVNPGPDAESAMRSLARKGFDLIIGTTFEYGPTMSTLAEEFPKTYWLHVSGYYHNDTNYGDLFGSMEQMKYLAGMVGGARAKADGNTKIGYVAPWPLPEVIRLGDAFMLGAKSTCPECTMEVRWINTWYDPDKEKQAAQSLLDAGVDVVLIGSDTPGPLVAASNAGKWAFTYDYINSCQPAPDHCLGTPYWNWGPAYLDIVKQIRAGTWKPSFDFRTAADGIVGFYGFMPGQTPQPGVPKDVIPLVQAKLADMVAGKFTDQDIFKGPIKDNTGQVHIPDGQTVTIEDLFGIDAATIKSMGLTGYTPCKYCFTDWLVDGIQGSVPAMPSQ